MDRPTGRMNGSESSKVPPSGECTGLSWPYIGTTWVGQEVQEIGMCKPTHFIMTPREKNILKSTVRLIYSTLGHELPILWIRIWREVVRINDLVWISATNREGILRGSSSSINPVEETDLRTPTMAHWPLKSIFNPGCPERRERITYSGWNVARSFPRSCTRPTTCIHSGLPSRRMASAVCSRCSIWVTLVYSKGLSIAETQERQRGFSRLGLNRLSLNWEAPSLPRHLWIYNRWMNMLFDTILGRREELAHLCMV